MGSAWAIRKKLRPSTKDGTLAFAICANVGAISWLPTSRFEVVP